MLQALQGEADAAEQVQWDGCAIDSTSIIHRACAMGVHPHGELRSPQNAAGAKHAPAKKGALVARRRRVVRERKAWGVAAAV